VLASWHLPLGHRTPSPPWTQVAYHARIDGYVLLYTI
jgi:hypothetical protein